MTGYLVFMRVCQETTSHTNIDGLAEAFINNNIGGLTVIGWKRMSAHSINLIPWRKHWSHCYANPNKAYEYSHAGLFVMCTGSLKPVIKTLKEHCTTFEDHSDLISKLASIFQRQLG